MSPSTKDLVCFLSRW